MLANGANAIVGMVKARLDQREAGERARQLLQALGLVLSPARLQQHRHLDVTQVELELHVVPVLLGDGARIFDNLGDAEVQLEQVRAVEAPGVTHLKYRVT